MANLYTYMITAMKNSTDMNKHHQSVVRRLDEILNSLDMLLEDPLFIDNIHGEQDLSLDQTVELIKIIKAQFLPEKEAPEISPLYESGAFDVS